jgi:hypothetical protein
MENNLQQDERYFVAQRKVKSIRGFYVHLFFYVVINAFISFQIYMHNDGDFWQYQNFTTAFFWGIGLLAHGVGVFGSSLIFGKEWEERKIQELMNKDKNQKWE